MGSAAETTPAAGFAVSVLWGKVGNLRPIDNRLFGALAAMKRPIDNRRRMPSHPTSSSRRVLLRSVAFGNHYYRVYGVVLIVLGLGGYFASDMVSPTALIPAAFGILLVIFGAMARDDKRRKFSDASR